MYNYNNCSTIFVSQKNGCDDLSGLTPAVNGHDGPLKTVEKAIELMRPDYLCISVTNVYNLVSVKRTIEAIQEKADYDFIKGMSQNGLLRHPFFCQTK